MFCFKTTTICFLHLSNVNKYHSVLDSDLFRSTWICFTLVNLTHLAPVLCSHPLSVIIPEASPEVYSQMSMVEPVRAAISSTERHTGTSPLPSTDDYWRPSPGPVPHVHSSPQANADLLPLDRLHNGREEEDVEPESTKFPFNLVSTDFQFKFK